MKNINIIIILMCFVIIACGKSDNYKPGEPVQNMQKIKNMKSFNDMFELTTTVSLDIVDPIMLNGIRYIFILDDGGMIFNSGGMNSKVFIFDNTGKVIGCIDKKGEAGGEYRECNLISVDKHYIYIFDDMLQRINVYDMTGKFNFTFKVKGKYSSMTAENGFIFLRRGVYLERKYTKDIIDVYGPGGKYSKSIIVPVISSSDRNMHLGIADFGLLKNNEKFYTVSCDDFKIYCFDSKKDVLNWTTNELPNWVKIEKKMPANRDLKSLHEWVKKSSYFSSFFVYESGLIQLGIDNKLIFYDNNGCYLTNFDHNNHSKFAIKNNNLYEFQFQKEINEKEAKKIIIKIYKLDYSDNNEK